MAYSQNISELASVTHDDGHRAALVLLFELGLGQRGLLRHLLLQERPALLLARDGLLDLADARHGPGTIWMKVSGEEGRKKRSGIRGGRVMW